MDLKTQLGIHLDGESFGSHARSLTEYVNLKLASLGAPIFGTEDDHPQLRLAGSLLANYRERGRLLSEHLNPVDQRIQDFLETYLEGTEAPPRLPTRTFTLDRHGLARVLSLPPDADSFESDIINSYRLHNGVLHNPKSDRRTTKGVFHVVEGGLPIADDKKSVPRLAFSRLLKIALTPPRELMRLPFTATQQAKAELFVSLLLRPVTCPEVPGVMPQRSMEVRFFAPGNLVCNLDFVESIFGNAGDPNLAANNAALDVDGWTGTTGCVILAPHMIGTTKKELGLPHASKANERQTRDGMCWEADDELYNEGGAFKLTARDHRGVVVTLIADNYFGYCKKEVKTQIGYTANLFGLAEEEHAGGAHVCASYDLAEEFVPQGDHLDPDSDFDSVVQLLGGRIDVQPEGYGIDTRFPQVVYLPNDVRITLNKQLIVWSHEGAERRLRLDPGTSYVLPSGYQVEMVKPQEGRRWRLVGTVPEGVFCHKPSTVSGGGKSEISKPISDAILTGPVYLKDIQEDFDVVDQLIARDYAGRFRDPEVNADTRPLLSPERTLGSVVKLITPSEIDYTDEYNQWLESIPQHVKDLVLIVKRLYKDDWGDRWRERFSVDDINGSHGNELRYRGRKLSTQFLRVGYGGDGAWRTFGLRKDFFPATKLSEEDDISATAVVPADQVEHLDPRLTHPSVKFVHNCEYRFFQRPDDAVVRGYDKKTEADMAAGDIFFSNYEPIDRATAATIVADAIRFEQYTPPMQQCIRDFVQADGPDYIAIPSHPRIVDGTPTKNPRYLQVRPDVETPRRRYLTELRARLARKVPADMPVPQPVTDVLPGRRNNPPEAGIRPMCCYNPVHYMELPEFFMEVIASLTGKSPSTTGAGSEGALTKGPFNALWTIHDLNNALVSFALSGYQPYITAAGYVGPHFRVDHDISLLVPELWCRMRPEETDPRYLIEGGYLERVEDFQYEGKTVHASRLGYRITQRFARHFCGRVFNNPATVLTQEMLQPELQDMAIFADSVDNIVQAHKRVAESYRRDGSIEAACPPLEALLDIMSTGSHKGRDVNDPQIRVLFTREAVLGSDWYRERLENQQLRLGTLLETQIAALEAFLARDSHADVSGRLRFAERLETARSRRAQYAGESFGRSLIGSLGVDAIAPRST